MNLRSALMGTTALLGAAAFVVPSSAAAFDVNISGWFRFQTVLGDLEESLGRDAPSFDFVTDSEVHVQAVNTDDETGIRYGVTVEFETDPQNNLGGGGTNTGGAVIDESWIFIDGAFGGFRLGNEDGALDNSKIGAYNIAAGTGGIDGQGVVAPVQFAPTNSGDATKIRYDSPSFGGFTIHASYTPYSGEEGNRVATGNENYENWIEGSLNYDGSFGGLDVGVAGSVGAAEGNAAGVDDYLGFNVGAVVGFSGFDVSASYWEEDDGPSGDQKAYTLGAAAALGPADLSVTWAQIFDSDSGEEPTNLVLSGTVGVLPGVSLRGDVAFFDRDAGGDDDGVSGVVRLQVAF